MMDSMRFSGSSEPDFYSCGRQGNDSFQKFASAKLELDFLLISVYLNQGNLIEQVGGGYWKISLSDRNVAASNNFRNAHQNWKNSFSLLGEQTKSSTEQNKICFLFWYVNGGWKQTGGCQSSKYFFFESSVNTAARGSIVWRRKEHGCCLISLQFKTVSCQQLQIVKLVILIYIYSIFYFVFVCIVSLSLVV